MFLKGKTKRMRTTPVGLLRPVLWFYVCWVCVAVFVLGYVSILPPEFISQWGPHALHPSKAFSITLPWQWWVVAGFTWLNHGISTFSGGIIEPWITTQVQNESVKILPWTDVEVHASLAIYWVAGWVDYMLFFMISLSRFDLLVIGVMADLVSKQMALRVHLKNKQNSIL